MNIRPLQAPENQHNPFTESTEEELAAKDFYNDLSQKERAVFLITGSYTSEVHGRLQPLGAEWDYLSCYDPEPELEEEDLIPGIA